MICGMPGGTQLASSVWRFSPFALAALKSASALAGPGSSTGADAARDANSVDQSGCHTPVQSGSLPRAAYSSGVGRLGERIGERRRDQRQPHATQQYPCAYASHPCLLAGYDPTRAPSLLPFTGHRQLTGRMNFACAGSGGGSGCGGAKSACATRHAIGFDLAPRARSRAWSRRAEPASGARRRGRKDSSQGRRGPDEDAQHRTLPDDPHRQPAPPRTAGEHDVRAGRGRAGRRGRAGCRDRFGGGRDGRAPAPGGNRDRRRRRDVEAELRHLHQGSPPRLRRGRQQLQLPRSRRISRHPRQGVRRCRPRAPPRAPPAIRRSASGTVEAPRLDAARLVAAADGLPAFKSAASPRRHRALLRQPYYPTREDYVFAIAEALAHEYEAIAGRRHHAPARLPRSRHGPHVQFADLDSPASGRRWSSTSPRSTMRCATSRPIGCACICAGAIIPAPHHCDVPLAEIIDIVWTAKPATVLLEGRQPPPRARISPVRGGGAARGQDHLPGPDRAPVDLYEHPALIGRPHRPATPILSGARMWWRASIAASASTSARAGLDPEVVWAKLAALAQGAEIASRRYF